MRKRAKTRNSMRDEEEYDEEEEDAQEDTEELGQGCATLWGMGREPVVGHFRGSLLHAWSGSLLLCCAMLCHAA